MELTLEFPSLSFPPVGRLSAGFICCPLCAGSASACPKQKRGWSEGGKVGAPCRLWLFTCYRRASFSLVICQPAPSRMLSNRPSSSTSPCVQLRSSRMDTWCGGWREGLTSVQLPRRWGSGELTRFYLKITGLVKFSAEGGTADPPPFPAGPCSAEGVRGGSVSLHSFVVGSQTSGGREGAGRQWAGACLIMLATGNTSVVIVQNAEKSRTRLGGCSASVNLWGAGNLN